MKTWIFYLILPSIPALAAGGNGSSGIGNIVPISDGISAQVAKSQSLKMNAMGDRMFDADSGEELFALDHIDKRNASKDPGELVNSRMGQVSGYELIPRGTGKPVSKQPHYWLVCKKARCLRLTPLSTTNPKIDSVIGSLREDP